MRQSLAIVMVAPAVMLSFGCTCGGDWSVSRMLGWDDSKMPNMDKYPKADYALAEKVENMGHRIIAQNNFIGIDPFFHTIGVPEAVLFHRGPEEVFISEGLVRQCKTDTELAGVLCSELGQMVAEKKAVRRVGADRDSFPEVGLPGGGQIGTGGGTPVDAARQAELAYQDRRPKPQPTIDPIDANKQARELLTGSGFDPATLDQIQPLLRQSARGMDIRKQMSGSAPAPTWSDRPQ